MYIYMHIWYFKVPVLLVGGPGSTQMLELSKAVKPRTQSSRNSNTRTSLKHYMTLRRVSGPFWSI